MLIALLGSAFYRIRMRGLADARSAIDNAEAAERAAAVLAAERQRLSAVIEGTDVGIWEWDVAGKTWVIDQRCAAMIGRSAEALSPIASEAWQALVHPDDLPQLHKAVEACMNTPAATCVHEFRMLHADGHWIWVLTHGKVMERGADARALRMAGIHLDVSARKAVELSLKESEIKFRSLFELSPVGICAQRSAHRTIPARSTTRWWRPPAIRAKNCCR